MSIKLEIFWHCKNRGLYLKMESKIIKALSLKLSLTLLCVATFCFISSTTIAQPSSDLWAFWDQSDESSTEQMDHQRWGDILSKYLDGSHPSAINRFNYVGVDQSDHQKLKNYIGYLTGMDPRAFNKNEQFAYWINLYNALTVELVLREYPISSITKIKKRSFSFAALFSFGPWDIEVAEVAGQPITLNDIEHRILRPIWQDHRIHFAVNCASLGCPSLYTEPFLALKIDEQLNESASDYLAHPRGVRFEGDVLILSEIFDWYQEDFGDKPDEMLHTLSQYLPLPLAEQVKQHKGKLKYQYDWGLNES